MTAAPDVPTGTDALDAMLADPELRESLAVVVANAPTLAERRQTIQYFLDSPILRPEIVGVIGDFGEAALEADRRTRGRQVHAGGPFSLVRQLKDPDVQETISFLMTFARVFGRHQRHS